MWFAWYPVRTQQGCIVWLRKVNRVWSWDINSWCDSCGWSGYDGGWIYNLKDK